jgi:hypothetical protein
MTRSPALPLAGLVAALAAGAPRPVAAQAAPAAQLEAGAPATVSVEVVVITASASGKPSDPRLARIARRLEGTLFNSFQQVGEKTVTLRPESQESVALTHNRRLELRPIRLAKSGQVGLLIQLFGKTGAKLVDAEAALPPEQDFMVAGPKDEDGTLMVYLRHAGSQR